MVADGKREGGEGKGEGERGGELGIEGQVRRGGVHDIYLVSEKSVYFYLWNTISLFLDSIRFLCRYVCCFVRIIFFPDSS